MQRSGCLGDDTMALFVAGTLAGDRRPAVESHLDDCAECRRAVAALIAGDRDAVTRSFVTGDSEVTTDLAGPVPRLDRAETIVDGDRIGRYVVERALGRGGMGVVYAARDPELDRRVAIKLVQPRLWRDASTGARELLRSEARAMAKIVHPNVVAVHDVGTIDDQLFVAMELIGGGSLDEWLAAKPRAWREVLAVCVDAGRGLAAVHAAGLVHRDVKPSNVMIDDAGRARIADFGLAVLGRDDPGGSAPPAGTPAYMSPEQHTGAAVGPASDQFSYCATVYEALHGERPFAGATRDAIAAAIAAGEIRPPPANTRVPSKIRRALVRGLAADPAARWPSIDGLLARLQPRQPVAWIGAAAGGVVAIAGAIAATALASGGSDDRCADGAARLAATWSPERARAAAATLRPADGAAAVIDAIARKAGAWSDTHRATCAGDPARAGATATCLEARRRELATIVDDLVARERPVDGALSLVARWIHDPAACREPPPGMVRTLVPPDPVHAEAITDLRYRLLATEDEFARDPGAAVVERAREIADAAAGAGWPMVEAEAQFVLAMVSRSVDDAATTAALRRAIAVAETSHHDRIAAQSWIELAESLAFDAAEVERALEYVENARAASARLGAPPDLEALVLYMRGVARAVNGDPVRGLPEIEAARVLAEKSAPEHLDTITVGLAEAYRADRRCDEAAAIYRRMLDRLIAERGPGHLFELNLRNGLAACLSTIGDHEGAIVEATAATELGDRKLGKHQLERALGHATLAEVYYQAGRYAEALAAVNNTTPLVIASVGKRSERYGWLLQLQASVLLALDRIDDAAAVIDEACEIAAFTSGDGSIAHATCLLDSNGILQGQRRFGEARDRVLAALPMLVATYGDDSTHVANAYLDLGDCYLGLAQHDRAVEAFGNARKRVAGKTDEFDRGVHAGAEFGLARALARRDPARADAHAAAAIAGWESLALWADNRDEAVKWLARRRKR